ncbi:MAG: ATP-binding protein [Cyanobacteria bacterium]|nr:ATP-binding protein [Cyanobacteriota bacterium]
MKHSLVGGEDEIADLDIRSWLKIKIIDNNQKIRMEVVDQGRGIPPEEKAGVFEKFKQLPQPSVGADITTGARHADNPDFRGNESEILISNQGAERFSRARLQPMTAKIVRACPGLN